MRAPRNVIAVFGCEHLAVPEPASVTDIFEISVLQPPIAIPVHPEGSYALHIAKILISNVRSGTDIDFHDLAIGFAVYDGDEVKIPTGRFLWIMLMTLIGGEEPNRMRPAETGREIEICVRDFLHRPIATIVWEMEGCVAIAIPGHIGGFSFVATNIDDERNAVPGDVLF